MSFSLYTVALFVHLLGVVGLFAGIALNTSSMANWRRAGTLGELRMWAGKAKNTEKVLKFSVLALMLGGLYLSYSANLWAQGWVGMAILATFANAAAGPLVIGRTVGGIMKDAGGPPEAPVSAEVRARVEAPKVWIVERAMSAIGVGLVFLMVFRPTSYAGAFAVLIAFAAIGASSVIGRRSAGPALSGELPGA
ncbi:MAG TPA: hypothetical protein V6D47_13640 [Oscillatoriaceae cyanobacterium]